MAFSRRDTIHLLLSGALSTALFTLFKVSGAKALPRPPGALEEKAFLEYCARCYRCVDVCPVDAIQPAGIAGGIISFGTPVLEHKKCIFCMACIKECPTGAIAKISRDEIDIGNAVINRGHVHYLDGSRRSARAASTPAATTPSSSRKTSIPSSWRTSARAATPAKRSAPQSPSPSSPITKR